MIRTLSVVAGTIALAILFQEAGQTQRLLGFLTTPKQGGAWIMAAGTSEAHLMLS